MANTTEKYPLYEGRLVLSEQRAAKIPDVEWVIGVPFKTTLEFYEIQYCHGKYRIYFKDIQSGIIYNFPPSVFKRAMMTMEKGKLKGEWHVIKGGKGFALTFYEPKLSATQALAREARKAKKRQAAAKENWKRKRKEQRELLAAKRKETQRIRKEKAEAAAKLAKEKREHNRLMAAIAKKDKLLEEESQ